MFRVSLANAFAKRSLRPLHEKHQATPVNVLLDASNAVVVANALYSGMPAELTSDGQVIPYTTKTNPCWGLFALDKNDSINDTDGQPTDLGTDSGGTPFAVWQGGPDAYFRVTDPGNNAVLANVAWVVGDDVYADSSAHNLDRTDTDSGNPVIGHVVEVIGTGDIVIQLSAPTA